MDIAYKCYGVEQSESQIFSSTSNDPLECVMNGRINVTTTTTHRNCHILFLLCNTVMSEQESGGAIATSRDFLPLVQPWNLYSSSSSIMHSSILEMASRVAAAAAARATAFYLSVASPRAKLCDARPQHGTISSP